MRLTRKRFVLLFLAFGYAFHFVTKFLLAQPAQAIWAVEGQAPWQRLASTVLSPIKVVLVSPIEGLLQDPDPPPPFRLILLTAYWSVLALGLHHLLSRRSARA